MANRAGSHKKPNLFTSQAEYDAAVAKRHADFEFAVEKGRLLSIGLDRAVEIFTFLVCERERVNRLNDKTIAPELELAHAIRDLSPKSQRDEIFSELLTHCFPDRTYEGMNQLTTRPRLIRREYLSYLGYVAGRSIRQLQFEISQAESETLLSERKSAAHNGTDAEQRSRSWFSSGLSLPANRCEFNELIEGLQKNWPETVEPTLRQFGILQPIPSSRLSESLRQGKLRSVIEAHERGEKLTAKKVAKMGRELPKLKSDARALKCDEQPKILTILNSIPSN